MIYFKKQQGIALLEVLIAFVIITISVVAIYQLQNKYMRNEISSSTRLTALQIAESKLDDLRTFASLSVSSGVPTYDIIDTNTGGSIASGAISSSNANVSPFVYNLSWTSTQQTGSKVVKVTVSWNSGADQVQLSGSVVQATRISSDRLTNSSKVGSYKPVIMYTPGAAPDVISITTNTATGTKQETTKPLPEVSNSGGSVQVRFDTVTYSSVYNTQVLSDSLTLSCGCTFGSGTKNTALPAKMTTIDGLLFWSAPNSDAYVPKSWGLSSNKQQSSLCDICCEHHFDYGTDNIFDNHYNKIIDYASSAYMSKYNSSLTAVSSGDYIDSCRLLRIDGYYKPMPDWNLVKLVVVGSDFLKKTANQTSYQDYIKYVVTTYVSLQKSKSWPSNKSDLMSGSTATSAIQSFSDWLKTPANVASGGDATTNISIDKTAVTPINKQLIARGIFVDVMSNDWLTNTASSASSTDLTKVPFYDVNMTLLSQWSTSSSSVATVYSEPIKTLTDATSDYYGVYKRGYILDGQNGTATITATAFQGNSSVAGYQVNKNSAEIAVSNYDNTKGLSDTIDVTVGGAVTNTVTVNGSLYCLDQKATTTTTGTGQNKVTNTTYSAVACDTNGNNKTFDVLTIASSNATVPTTCTLSAVNSTASPVYRPFSCTTSQGASFNITVGGTQTGYTVYPAPKMVNLSPTSTATTVQIGCINAYQTALSSNPGINFDSSTGCVSN